MMDGPSYFEIQASDIRRAMNFYKTIFGWKFIEAKEILVEYWRIETSTSKGGLLKRPAEIPGPEQGTNAFVCSMQTKNFDKTAKEILALGGKVALPKFAILGVCWQGYFLDTEGNTFGIYQPDEKAK